jgi:cobalt-zinc-cadmium efflux system protein
MSGFHAHTHGHSHAHSQGGAGGISSRQMWAATAMTFTFCLIEALVGYRSNSLALMADAGHNFADSMALALSAFALWMAHKREDSKRTFGYHRVGILAALVNAVGLVVMAGIIFWEALLRIGSPQSVQSDVMIWMALAAIVLNAAIAWWLSSAAKGDLNIKSAYLHMLGDAAASLGVVVAGIVIALTGWLIADPLVSILFAALVLWSSWSICAEAIAVLLESTPRGFDLAKAKHAIRHVAGVTDLHDLHVWTIASGLVASTVHIVVADQLVSSSQKIQAEVTELLAHDFSIDHCTVQIEAVDCGGHEHQAHHHGHSH